MKKLLTILLLIFVCSNVYAEIDKPTYQVGVRVVGSRYEDECNSYIRRELRKHSDVEVTDTSNRFIIELWVIRNISFTTGQPTGYSVAYVFLEKFSSSHLFSILNLSRKPLEEEHEEKLKDIIDSHEICLGMYLQSGSLNDLEKICKDIVLQFDGFLENRRQMGQGLEEAIRKLEKIAN